ncbi:hypothetical protein [Arthrobacter sp. SD76]|uniref:hypothetical protein n=1 Tax=Arthrobacter sp. SD76 TaxID=3415007 RepID=UPI003C793AE6
MGTCRTRPHLTEEWDGTYPADEFSADLARAEDLLYANDSLWGQGSLRQQWLAQAITDRLGEAPKRVPLAGRLSGSGRIEFSGRTSCCRPTLMRHFIFSLGTPSAESCTAAAGQSVSNASM